MEVFSAAEARQFFGTATDVPAPDSDDWVTAVMNWRAADDAEERSSILDQFWPDDALPEDNVMLGMMSITLTAEIAQEAGALERVPTIESLHLSESEREERLRLELDHVAQNCRSQRLRLSIERKDPPNGFVFQVTKGRIKKVTDRYRVELSSLGVASTTRL
jgi:hypothetical protein